MLLDQTIVDDALGIEAAPPPRRARGAIGPTAVRLAAALREDDVIMIATGEQRAAALAIALEALVADAATIFFPPSDGMPGDASRSSPSAAGRRVAALRRLRNSDGRRTLLITTAEAASLKLAQPATFDAPLLILRQGDPIELEHVASLLEENGYFLDERVDEPGEMAQHGSVFDIFPADADRPVRIDIEHGVIASIRLYDPLSQRAIDALDHIELPPAREPEPGTAAVTILDYLADAVVASDVGTEERRAAYLDLARDAAGAGQGAALVDEPEWRAMLDRRRQIDIAAGNEVDAVRHVEARDAARSASRAVARAREEGNVVVVAGSARDLRFLARRFSSLTGSAPAPAGDWSTVEAADPGSLLSIVWPLDRGWADDGLTVIAASDVLGSRAGTQATGGSVGLLTGEGIEFRLGDAIIHEDHGLGVLRGLESVSADGIESDAIRLEYAGDAQRLVPVEEAGKLWRYGADGEALTLDRLDGASWQKRRSEVEAAIAATARTLTEIAAERANRTAPKLEPPVAAYERFVAGFGFTETADQARAIAAVREDMAFGMPMDRLIVGDVGYGKTEVALRAAALAALAGWQVAVVAPTTVLVRQHVETFRRRFAAAGINVAALSRLTPAAEARTVKKGLADGSIDIVIGTKAIAGKGVSFARLGLVVIDEEQRFGVADKQKLRALCEACHILTLTATPIPRTLQTALVGLQALSVIATPPALRQPVRTVVGSLDPAAVRAALLREKARAGQSFVVVPRIEDMAAVASRLRTLVPEFIVREAHGKMPAAMMDEVMVGFAAGKGDILLATNIIEAGLDVPRANTMAVWGADRFGLSQLHQLRGRVGRGARRGQTLLMTDPDAAIAPATLKRLRTMQALDRLGAGFAISARDLDLRGAGDLLGDDQAGHMKLIGVGLYQELLGSAVRAARGETVDRWLPELHLGISGRFPLSWIPEPELRINLYARLARAASIEALEALVDEVEDRFGPPPEEVRLLFVIARISQLAAHARIARIDAGPAAIALTPRPDFRGDAEALSLVAKGERLLLAVSTEEEERLNAVTTLLEALAAQ